METVPSTNRKPRYLTELAVFVLITTAVALTAFIIIRTDLLPIASLGSPTRPGELTVATKDFKFAASELRVTAGETVKLNLVNNDRLPHSFDLDQFNLHHYMPGNESVYAEFTPTEPGTYTYYCAIPGHQELGMAGTLIVEPNLNDD